MAKYAVTLDNGTRVRVVYATGNNTSVARQKVRTYLDAELLSDTITSVRLVSGRER